MIAGDEIFTQGGSQLIRQKIFCNTGMRFNKTIDEGVETVLHQFGFKLYGHKTNID